MRSVFEHDGFVAAILHDLCETAGLEGAAVLDLSQEATPVTYSAGLAGIDTIAAGRALLETQFEAPIHTTGADGRAILAAPWTLPLARRGGLLIWRAPGERMWTPADHGLAAAVAMLLLRTLTSSFGQIGIDRLTGIPNRRWFIDEVDRRIDRLDRDDALGTLTLIDIDDLGRLNAQHGRAQGDRVLVRLASQLRGVIRPSDLVARTGDDEFALWQDGMDHLTAAERAEMLGAKRLFNGLPYGTGVTISIGIVTRWPGTGEDVRTLLRRAHMAVRDVKARGGRGWRVSQPEPAGGRTDPAK